MIERQPLALGGGVEMFSLTYVM